MTRIKEKRATLSSLIGSLSVEERNRIHATIAKTSMEHIKEYRFLVLFALEIGLITEEEKKEVFGMIDSYSELDKDDKVFLAKMAYEIYSLLPKNTNSMGNTIH